MSSIFKHGMGWVGTLAGFGVIICTGAYHYTGNVIWIWLLLVIILSWATRAWVEFWKDTDRRGRMHLLLVAVFIGIFLTGTGWYFLRSLFVP